MSDRARGKSNSNGDLPWSELSEQLAPTPDRAGLLAGVKQRTAMRLVACNYRLRLWRGAAVAAAAALVVVVVVLFGVRPGQRLPGEVAWATAEGYVLTYRVLGLEASETNELAHSTYAADFVLAVEQWARDNGCAFQSESGTPAVNIRSLWANRGTTPIVDCFQIDLIGADEQQCDGLMAALNPLAGAGEPEVEIYTLYFEEGGLTEALIGRSVIINGVQYSFPRNFSSEENRCLRYLFDSREELGEVRFIAFIDLDRQRPQLPDYKYGLGDVVRAGFDEAGNLLLDTLEVTWNEGRLAVIRFNYQNYQQCYVALPEGTPEDEFDYLEALIKQITPSFYVASEVNEYSYVYDVNFGLDELDQLLAPGYPKYTAAEAERSQRIKERAMAVFDRWMEQYPEYGEPQAGIVTYITGMEFGELVYGIHIRHQADDDTALAHLLAQLREVDGLGEAVVERRINEDTTERMMEQAVQLHQDRFANPDPALTAVDPAAWTAREAILLTVRVLGYVESEELAGYTTEQGAALEAAVLEWAADRGIAIDDPEADPGLIMGGNTNRGAPFWRGHYVQHFYDLKLLGVDEKQAASLVAAVEPLPGVWVYSEKAATLVFHRERKHQLWQGHDLVVNGQRYRFPYDLSIDEAGFVAMQSLQPPGRISYWAYLNIGHSAPDHFDIADIARMEIEPDGTVAITDYLPDWPAGREQQQELDPRLMSGWQFSCSAEAEAAPDFDPAALLLRAVNYEHAPERGPETMYRLIYYLLPQEYWLVGGDGEQLAARRRESRQLADAAEAILQRHKDAHPEYRETQRHGNQFVWQLDEFDGAVLTLQVWLSDADDAAISGLREQLAEIRGMPEPELRTDDYSPL